MLKPNRAILRQYRQLAVLVSLAFATAVCLGLLALRITYSHRLVYTYLAWNLFLAWLPMVCALAAYNAGKRRSRLSWLVVAGCALAGTGTNRRHAATKTSSRPRLAHSASAAKRLRRGPALGGLICVPAEADGSRIPDPAPRSVK